MKLFKKTASVVLAMTMATALVSTTALATTASAVDTGAETTKLDVSDHQYKAYQIFSGTQADENNAVLCDIQWGKDIDKVSFLAELKKMDAYKDCETAEDVAKVVAEFGTDSNEARAFAKLADQYIKKSVGDTVYGTDIGVTSTIDGKVAEPGYYLVVDTTATSAEKDDAKNLSLLQLTKNTSLDIISKTDIPKVEKKVKEETPYVAEQVGITGYALEEGYNDVADYDIGDDVPFMLIGTMPTTLADYDTYKYIFHDTLSAGLTYNGDIEIFVDDDNKYGNDTKIDSGYTVESKDDGTLTISFDDVKSLMDASGNTLVTKDSKIIVKYTAELNDDAIIGLDGNTNEVYLQYSNNPNFNGSGDSDDGDGDSNNDNDETGNTPKDKVIVFTYELDVTKEDSVDARKLEGAEFKLQNADGAFYKRVDIIDEENPDIVRWHIEWVDNEDDATVLTSDENGLFVVKGIDDGVYTLTETKAPTGYNLLKEAIELTITAVTVNSQNWNDFVASNALTDLSIAVTDAINATQGKGDTKTGIVDMAVKNSEGSLLPETGGIGTVAIYTVGTLLVVVAGVLLVTKKRMSK